MNEFPGADLTETLSTCPQLSGADTLDDIDDTDGENDVSLNTRREGLPPGFRMRHDKHYVEELMSTPPTSPGAPYQTGPRPSAAPPAAIVGDRPRTPGAPRPSVGAVELIAARLESIVAHGAVAREHTVSTDPVSRTVQAEVQRVSRFARAVAIIARQTEPVRRPVAGGEIAAAIRAACTRAVRLNGMDCVVTIDDAAFAVGIERALVVQAIAGTIDALLDLTQINGTDQGVDEDGRITVSLQGVKARPALIVDIACPALSWRAARTDRFFDNADEDFAGAPAAGILLASAAHVVRLHGGRVEAKLQDGISVRYVFPQDAPRASTA